MGLGAIAGQFIQPAMQFGLGAYQMIKGSSMSQDRPTMEIPESSMAALEQSRQLAFGDVPGLQRAKERASQSTSNAVEQMNRAGVTDANAIAGAYRGEQQQQANLGVQESEYRARMRRQYQGALGRMGQLEQQQWDYNVNQPYQRRMAQRSALLGAGIQNFLGAGRSATSYFQGQQQRDFYENLYGNQGDSAGMQGAGMQGSDNWFNRSGMRLDY